MRNLSEQIIIELLRSFCFVYAVVTSFAFGLANVSSFPLIGLVLVFLVHFFGKSSGDHLSPAVSLFLLCQNTLANLAFYCSIFLLFWSMHLPRLLVFGWASILDLMNFSQVPLVCVDVC